MGFRVGGQFGLCPYGIGSFSLPPVCAPQRFLVVRRLNFVYSGSSFTSGHSNFTTFGYLMFYIAHMPIQPYGVHSVRPIRKA